jgi:hypothetical protein
MTEILEKIAVGTFGETEEKCAFKEKDGKPVVVELENIEKDDLDSNVEAQANNGGKLGGNLEKGRHSEDTGTFNDIPRKAPDYRSVDEWRRQVCLYVPFTGQLTDEFGPAAYYQKYHSSAHHLIPGNASLFSSLLYKRYMEKGGKATSWGKTWEMKYDIGYNVNGSHNGVWLPNNFGIQQTGTPSGLKWSEYTAKAVGSDERRWIVAYVAASTKWKGSQFHDTHTTYNRNVKKLMTKLCAGLRAHQAVCQECEKKDGDKVLPPYKLKLRLYGISRVLRGYTSGLYQSWRDGYLTSDQYKQIKSNPAEWAWFKAVYAEAVRER